MVYWEVEFILGQGTGRSVKGCVDLVVLDYPELFLIEAKTIQRNSTKNMTDVRKKIRDQLSKAYDFFKHHFHICAHRAGVYRISSSREFFRYKIPRPIEDILAFKK